MNMIQRTTLTSWTLPTLLQDPWRKRAQLIVWARWLRRQSWEYSKVRVAESRLIEVTPPIIVRHEVTQHSTSIMSPSMNVHEPLNYSVSGKLAWGMLSTLLLIRM